MSLRLTIFKTGETAPDVVAAHGDYDAMFRAILEPLGVTCDVIEAHRGAPLPRAEALEAVLITGSPSSVTERSEWVEALAQLCREIYARQLPTLGVCYGHQLLAYAHGGAVEASTRGMEIGSTLVDLTPEGRTDALLGEISDGQAQLRFHQVHGDVVAALPPGAVHLAENRHTALQAFRLGTQTWAVQFHPEFTRPIMDMYIDVRADRVRALAQAVGLDPGRALDDARRSIEDTPSGPRLLARFVELASAR